MAKKSELSLRKTLASQAFLEGKKQEFLGFLEIGAAKELDRVRAEMHALLDSQLDAIQEMHTEYQKEQQYARRGG